MTDADPLVGKRSGVQASPSEHADPGTEITDRTPPKHEGLPILGSSPALFREGLDFGDRIKAHGDVVAYDALGTQFVAVFDPILVEEILVGRSHAFEKGEYETEFLSFIAPEGLVTVEGSQWRRQRQLLQPVFRPARIRAFAETMVADATVLAENWDDGAVVPLRDEFSTYALSVLTHTLLDVDLDAERGAVVREAVDAISTRTTGVDMFVPEWLPTPSKRRYRRSVAALDDLIATLIAERRTGTDEYDDLLAALLAAEFDDGSTLSASTIRDQLVTFLFAGHETSATALTYACWLLAGHTDVRVQLEEELATVLGDRDPIVADLSDLQYTEQVVMEALRLYPPAYNLFREPTEETTLGEYTISEDRVLHLSTYHIQRDERWWDAPDEFRPARFSEEDPGRPEYAYFPFGGGPRHCIGMRFAMMELKLALATLARRVRFERTCALDPSPRVVLDPGRASVRVRKR